MSTNHAEEASPYLSLKPFPQCVRCLLDLAKASAQLADTEKNPELLQSHAEEAALRILHECSGTAASSPEIANRILREIRSMTGVEDPYAHFKSREMERAEAVFGRIQSRVGEDLRSLVGLAALGNSLDFFENPDSVLGAVPAQLVQGGIQFSQDQIQRLEERLEARPKTVLYLTDNAGEIYFDVPLYKYIRERCGRAPLVVKGGPALNDLTQQELKSNPLAACFDEVVDTGTDGAGIDWSRTSQKFRDLIHSADLILSKGMANFETVYPRRLIPAAFFVFKVKCPPIQRCIGAPVGSFVALWKEPGTLAEDT
jgi:hypothetical protein